MKRTKLGQAVVNLEGSESDMRVLRRDAAAGQAKLDSAVAKHDLIHNHEWIYLR